MPLVHVDMTAGKADADQKRRLIERLTDAVAEVLGADQRRLVVVTLTETPLGNRGVGGKVPGMEQTTGGLEEA